MVKNKFLWYCLCILKSCWFLNDVFFITLTYGSAPFQWKVWKDCGVQSYRLVRSRSYLLMSVTLVCQDTKWKLNFKCISKNTSLSKKFQFPAFLWTVPGTLYLHGMFPSEIASMLSNCLCKFPNFGSQIHSKKLSVKRSSVKRRFNWMNIRSNGIRSNGVRSNGVSVKWPFGQKISAKWSRTPLSCWQLTKFYLWTLPLVASVFLPCHVIPHGEFAHIAYQTRMRMIQLRSNRIIVNY
jgi:hypothetical protein